MSFKVIALIIVAAGVSLQAQAATMRSSQRDNVAALFIKDANSGQLRFLAHGFGNNQINKFITNKQDFLEKLRPAGSGNSGTGVFTETDTGTKTDTPIDTNTNTITSTGTDTATGTNTDTATDIDTLAGSRRPIIINTANSKRRRVPNRRHVNNRRRGNRRRRGNKKSQIIVIRPRA